MNALISWFKRWLSGDTRSTSLTYGLIEWDSSMEPTLIVGSSAEAVQRKAIAILGRNRSDEMEDLPPAPEHDGPLADVVAWLDDMREQATVPWFTVMEETDVVSA